MFCYIICTLSKAVIRFYELTEGGILWFTNLTAIDPTMSLPLIMCLSNLLIIEVILFK